MNDERSSRITGHQSVSSLKAPAPIDVSNRPGDLPFVAIGSTYSGWNGAVTSGFSAQNRRADGRGRVSYVLQSPDRPVVSSGEALVQGPGRSQWQHRGSIT